MQRRNNQKQPGLALLSITTCTQAAVGHVQPASGDVPDELGKTPIAKKRNQIVNGSVADPEGGG